MCFGRTHGEIYAVFSPSADADIRRGGSGTALSNLHKSLTFVQEFHSTCIQSILDECFSLPRYSNQLIMVKVRAYGNYFAKTYNMVTSMFN